jgi:hypothetical protein
MTQEEKERLVVEIQHIPINSEQALHFIGKFTLVDATVIPKKDPEEMKAALERQSKELRIRCLTTDEVIERCKQDRLFYENLLMKLDEGVLFANQF